MKTRILMQTVLGVCCLAMAFGCATAGGSAAAKAPSGGDDKAAITKTLGDWGSALASKNVDTILAFYSDAFKDDEGRDKASFKELIEGVIANGYLDGAKIDLASAQVSVTGEEAVVAPIALSGDMGAISLSVSLKKETSGWRITTSRQA